MARHDALTGLANRACCCEKMGEALARMRKPRRSDSVFMLDLDHFKMVNDTLGHAVGD